MKILFIGSVESSYAYLETLIQQNAEVVTVGENCFIGSGTVINLKVNIPNSTSIASLSLVSKSIDNAGVYKGIPANV